MAERYTQVPRTTLWLVQGGELPLSTGTAVEIGSFYIGKGPITNQQYEAFAPDRRRPAHSPGDDDPVAGVTFDEAAAYCAWYAALAKKPFRLPTEAEWEFACRGGTGSRWFFGDDPERADTYVWHRGNSDGRCHEIETLRANPAGLHDLLGNVWEWVTASEGTAVLRGGSYRNTIEEMAADARRPCAATERIDDAGFRIVRPL